MVKKQAVQEAVAVLPKCATITLSVSVHVPITFNLAENIVADLMSTAMDILVIRVKEKDVVTLAVEIISGANTLDILVNRAALGLKNVVFTAVTAISTVDLRTTIINSFRIVNLHLIIANGMSTGVGVLRNGLDHVTVAIHLASDNNGIHIASQRILSSVVQTGGT